MPAVHVGSKRGDTLIPVNAKPDGTVDPNVSHDDDDNITVILKYKCHGDFVDTLRPVKGSACPIAAYSTLIRKSTHVVPLAGHANWVTLEVQYGAFSFSWQKKSGDTTQESSASFREFAVSDKRLGLSVAKQKQLLAKRQKTVGVINPKYTYTLYDAAWVWSEVNVISGVGATGSPTGMSGATANKWLKTERSVRESQDGLVEIRDSWDYNDPGWIVTEA